MAAASGGNVGDDLNVKLTGDADQLLKQIDDAIDRMGRLENSVKAVTTALQALNSQPAITSLPPQVTSPSSFTQQPAPVWQPPPQVQQVSTTQAGLMWTGHMAESLAQMIGREVGREVFDALQRLGTYGQGGGVNNTPTMPGDGGGGRPNNGYGGGGNMMGARMMGQVAGALGRTVGIPDVEMPVIMASHFGQMAQSAGLGEGAAGAVGVGAAGALAVGALIAHVRSEELRRSEENFAYQADMTKQALHLGDSMESVLPNTGAGKEAAGRYQNYRDKVIDLQQQQEKADRERDTAVGRISEGAEWTLNYLEDGFNGGHTQTSFEQDKANTIKHIQENADLMGITHAMANSGELHAQLEESWKTVGETKLAGINAMPSGMAQNRARVETEIKNAHDAMIFKIGDRATQLSNNALLQQTIDANDPVKLNADKEQYSRVKGMDDQQAERDKKLDAANAAASRAQQAESEYQEQRGIIIGSFMAKSDAGTTGFARSMAHQKLENEASQQAFLHGRNVNNVSELSGSDQQLYHQQEQTNALDLQTKAADHARELALNLGELDNRLRVATGATSGMAASVANLRASLIEKEGGDTPEVEAKIKATIAAETAESVRQSQLGAAGHERDLKVAKGEMTARQAALEAYDAANPINKNDETYAEEMKMRAEAHNNINKGFDTSDYQAARSASESIGDRQSMTEKMEDAAIHLKELVTSGAMSPERAEKAYAHDQAASGLTSEISVGQGSVMQSSEAGGGMTANDVRFMNWNIQPRAGSKLFPGGTAAGVPPGSSGKPGSNWDDGHTNAWNLQHGATVWEATKHMGGANAQALAHKLGIGDAGKWVDNQSHTKAWNEEHKKAFDAANSAAAKQTADTAGKASVGSKTPTDNLLGEIRDILKGLKPLR